MSDPRCHRQPPCGHAGRRRPQFVTRLTPLLERVAPVPGRRSGPWRRHPDLVLADRSYDHDKYRRLVRDLGVNPLIARRGTERGSGPGTQLRGVEGALAQLRWFCGLRIR
ncbi:hypothetical protein AB0I69_33145 [Streptomyces sp. NPDC050508]|uniref:hypothetical protein n=1 Tax=Streptomyces sp. NPDC050508 TaxID=3155405 RepID=UPI00341F27AE